MTSRLPPVLDPLYWDALYATPSEDGSNVIFRRSMAAGLASCAAVARSGETWLDCGCGTGRLAAGLSRLGLFAVGIDRDVRMTACAAALVREAPNRVDLPPVFAAACASRLPFAAGSIDGAAAVSLMGCLPIPEEFFGELARVLRAGAPAVVTFTNRESLLHKILNAQRRVLGRPATQGGYRSYSVAEAVTHLENAGFRAAETRFYNFVLTAGARMMPLRRAELVLEKRIRSGRGRKWGRNFVITARNG